MASRYLEKMFYFISFNCEIELLKMPDVVTKKSAAGTYSWYVSFALINVIMYVYFLQKKRY